VSRDLKRVPLTFAWPLHEIWGGFVNPYYQLAGRCPDCKNGYDRAKGRPDANAVLFHDQWYGNAPFDPVAYGAEPLSPFAPAIWRLASRNVDAAPDFYMMNAERIAREEFKHKALTGTFHDDDPLLVPFPAFDKEYAINSEARRLYELWRFQWNHHLIQADVDALVTADRLWDLTRRPRNEEQLDQLKAQAAAGGSSCWLDAPNGHHPTAAEVNAWSLEGFGHDGLNNSVCVRARCTREAVPYMCCRCQGSGKIWPTPEIERQYEDWQPTPPPTGDGYQLWEDCSEGSPVSPVFASLDELCEWSAEHATTFGPHKATAEEWKEMLDGGVVHAKVGNDIFL
jgi:hypothetical protein